jgi:hypothetical protein
MFKYFKRVRRTDPTIDYVMEMFCSSRKRCLVSNEMKKLTTTSSIPAENIIRLQQNRALQNTVFNRKQEKKLLGLDQILTNI